MKHVAWFSAIFAATTLVVAFRPCPAAYLQSDVEPVQGVDPPSRERVVRPRPSNPASDLLQRVEVGPPVAYRGLTAFPLVLHAARSRGIRTLDEALSRDWLEIREKGDAQVSHVRVRNRSGRPVFLMAGEILAGGKQDRVVRDDALVPPRSSMIDIPVYCGEQDRWTPVPGTFRGDGTLVAPGLRRMAAKAESQGAIWSEIDSQMAAAGVASQTRSYRQVYRDREVDDALREYASGLRHACRGQTVGAVFASQGRIVGCDVFQDPDLLDRLWDKICRSYATELVSDRRRRRWPPAGIGRHDVRRFLDRAAASAADRAPSAGDGELYRLRNAEGQVLVWRGDVVHCAVFPGTAHIQPLRPRPRPMLPR